MVFKNILVILSVLALVHCKQEATVENDSKKTNEKLSSDRSSLTLNTDSFLVHLKNDLKLIDPEVQQEFQNTSNVQLDSMISHYYQTIPNLYDKEQQRQYIELACQMVLIGMQRNLVNSFTRRGESCVDCTCSCCDEFKGMNYILKSAELGSTRALHQLKNYHIIKYDNFKEAIRILNKLADEFEDIDAIFELYYIYKEGRFADVDFMDETLIDLSKAFLYLDKAFDLGVPEAARMRGQYEWSQENKDSAFIYFAKSYKAYKANKNHGEFQIDKIIDNNMLERYGDRWVNYKNNK